MDPGKLGGLGKIAAVFLVVAIGLEAYARSSGQPFSLDLLHPTNVASKMGSLTVPNPVANLVMPNPATGGGIPGVWGALVPGMSGAFGASPPFTGALPPVGVSGRPSAVSGPSQAFTPMAQLV